MNQASFSPAVREITLALVDDLQKEEASIESLEKHLDSQLIALRSQQRNSLEELTLDTSNEVNKLHILHNSKKDHIRLLREELIPEAQNVTLEQLIAKLKHSYR